MASVVYFVQAGDGGPIKIGYTSNLKQRLASLRAEVGASLDVLGTIPGGRWTEERLHQKFDDFRLTHRREWFGPAPEIFSFIAAPTPVTDFAPLRQWIEEQGKTNWQEVAAAVGAVDVEAFVHLANRIAVPPEPAMSLISAATNGAVTRETWTRYQNDLRPSADSFLFVPMMERGATIAAIEGALLSGSYWDIKKWLDGESPDACHVLDLLLGGILTADEARRLRAADRDQLSHDWAAVLSAATPAATPTPNPVS